MFSFVAAKLRVIFDIILFTNYITTIYTIPAVLPGLLICLCRSRLAGYLTGSEDYFTHKNGGYLDLRDDLDPVFDEAGHYSAHLFTEKASDIIMAHDASQVKGNVSGLYSC